MNTIIESHLERGGSIVIVGESYREDNRTMLWVICPACREERGVKKKYSTESTKRLCKVCHLRNAKVNMNGLWPKSSEKREVI